MIDESTMADATQLSPRAAIALLTLQLRSTVQEAVEAEAAADAIDVDGALWQLRSRLTPLIDERRRALDEEVANERARAAEAIAAAHAEADRITSAAVEAAAAKAIAERAAAELARRDAGWQSLVAPPPVDPDVAEPESAPLVETPLPEVTELEEVSLLEALPLGAPLLDPPTVGSDAAEEPPSDDATPELFDQAAFWGHEPDEPADEPTDGAQDPPEPVAPPVPLPPPLPPTLAPDTLVQPATDPAPGDELWARTVDRSDDSTIRVTLDADSFARAFAAAMAPILEAREQQALQYVLPPAAYMQPQAPPSKRSFWAHAWHPDVLLSGLAMVIVIIVLVAWTG